MGTITKDYNFTAATTIDPTQVNANFNTIYTEFNGSISNANISGSAAITKTKISGTALVLTDILDEDTMSSDSAVYPPSQQSTKAYVTSSVAAIAIPTDGWTASSDTWVYASASTFTIAGVDRTTTFTKGTRLKFTNSGTKYAVVVSSSFSTNTTVTIAVNTDYTIANAAITSPYYSYAASPQGYPTTFSYTPTGVASSNVTLSGRFSVLGNTCSARILALFSGAITFTTMPTLPITVNASHIAKNNTSSPSGVGGYFDSGTANVPGGVFPCIVASDTVVNVVNSTGTAISASSPITWDNNDAFVVDLSYEI